MYLMMLVHGRQGQLTDGRECLAEMGGRTLHQLQGCLTFLLWCGSGFLPLVLI